MPAYTVIHGDVAIAAVEGPFDALFCDPPYGLKFMGQSWDHGVPSSAVWSRLAEHLRPGAGVVAFGGTRTWHRLACNIEDAGLEMRDSIVWHYATGWPKPADVSKYIDKALGAEREVLATIPNARGVTKAVFGEATTTDVITTPATPEAAHWAGYHANLKPSWEPALVFRKRIDGTLARNALEHGVAGLNIDGCRIGTDIVGAAVGITWNGDNCGLTKSYTPNPVVGRWPANTILCCACDGETCEPGCPVRVLDEQSGVLKSGKAPKGGFVRRTEGGVCYGAHAENSGSLFGDEGGASRFFYVAKVSRKERGPSRHPCMKPVKLCEHVARLLLPPPRLDGRPRRILVPFSGSGSEMVGALLAGWDEVIGIESDAQWIPVAEARCAEAVEKLALTQTAVKAALKAQ